MVQLPNHASHDVPSQSSDCEPGIGEVLHQFGLAVQGLIKPHTPQPRNFTKIDAQEATSESATQFVSEDATVRPPAHLVETEATSQPAAKSVAEDATVQTAVQFVETEATNQLAEQSVAENATVQPAAEFVATNTGSQSAAKFVAEDAAVQSAAQSIAEDANVQSAAHIAAVDTLIISKRILQLQAPLGTLQMENVSLGSNDTAEHFPTDTAGAASAQHASTA